jgi:hypothetical protein
VFAEHYEPETHQVVFAQDDFVENRSVTEKAEVGVLRTTLCRAVNRRSGFCATNDLVVSSAPLYETRPFSCRAPRTLQ